MKIVIFSGTTEGRQLSGMLCEYGFPHTVCVATEYGCDVMPPNPLVTVKVGRLDTDKMTGLLRSLSFGAEDTVVDATHPYASDVSDNIRRPKRLDARLSGSQEMLQRTKMVLGYTPM